MHFCPRGFQLADKWVHDRRSRQRGWGNGCREGSLGSFRRPAQALSNWSRRAAPARTEGWAPCGGTRGRPALPFFRSAARSAARYGPTASSTTAASTTATSPSTRSPRLTSAGRRRRRLPGSRYLISGRSRRRFTAEQRPWGLDRYAPCVSPRLRSRRAARRPASTRASLAGAGRP